MAETLADMIRNQARTTGDRLALSCQGTSLTYGELDERSNRVAQGLLAEGVERGERVAYLEKNSLEHFEVMLGAAKAGAVFCPVNWRLAPPEIAQVVDDARARVLVVGAEFVPVVDEIEPKLTAVERVVVIGEHPRHERYADWRDRHDAADPEVHTEPGDVVLQCYTSGTTGLPKGAMLSSTSLFAMAPAIQRFLGFDDDTVSLQVLPVFHAAVTGWVILGFSCGVHNVMTRDVDPAEILEVIPRYGVTHAAMVPAVFQFLLMTPGVERTDFTSLRIFHYGASPISEDLLTRALATFGCGFVQSYGLTETCGAAVTLGPEEHEPAGPNAHRLRSAGRPLPGVGLRIVAPDGTDVPTGEIGEIWINSPANLVGYWNLPEATASALTPDNWFKTGDAGYVDADGYLYIADRVNDMVISGGENIYPAEVENVLMSHPGVADVAVIGVPDDRWGETVKAVVVRAEGADVSEHDIVDYCRGRLARYKCPTSVDWIDVLPRNPTGKILKKDLREPYWSGTDRRVH